VNLGSDDCEVAGPYGDRNAVFLAWITNKRSANTGWQTESAMWTDEMNLARGEVEKTLPGGGLWGGANGARRPLVVLTCDLADTRAPAVAQHLNAVPRLPVVFGNYDVEEICTLIATRPDAPLCFAVGYSTWLRPLVPARVPVLQLPMPQRAGAPAIAARTPALEAAVRALGVTGDVRLALVHEDAADWNAAATELEASLVVNGKGAPAQEGGSFRVFAHPYGMTGPNIVPDLVQFAPHIVLWLGGAEFAKELLPAIESSATTRPFYLGTYLDVQPTLDAIGASDALRSRIEAIEPIATGDPSRLIAFINTFRAEFPGEPVPTFASGYEAFYTVVYAITAAGSRPDGTVSGADVARGVTALGSGMAVRVGAGDLNSGLVSVVTTGSASLSGYSSTLKFDIPNGWPRDKAAILCIMRNAATQALSFAPSGQVYDTATGTLLGSYACP
jgi:hypothetical protein